MNLFKVLYLILSYILTCCNTQSYQYPAQRRAGYSYSPSTNSYRPKAYSTTDSYYSKPQRYYASGSKDSSSSAYPTKSYYSSSAANRYPAQSSSTANRGYTSTSNAQRYPVQSSSTANRGYSLTSSVDRRYPAQSSSTANRGYSSTSSTDRRYPAQSSNTANRASRYPAQSSSTAYDNERRYSDRDTNAHTTKDYLDNSYNSNYKASTDQKSSQDEDKNKKRLSNADVENAKFAGAGNQENVEEQGRTALHLRRRKLLRQQLAASYYGNRCFPYGRDASGGAGKSVTPPPKEQGRFLFDLNIYNVHPQTAVGIGSSGCGGGFGGLGGGGFGGLGGSILGDSLGGGLGYGGGLGLGGAGLGLGGAGLGLGGGGLLSDPIAGAGYPAQAPGLNTFLNYWAPGILQNSLAVTARPLADPYPVGSSQDDDLQSDPDVDPNYRPQPVRRPRPPNRIYYDSAGAPPVTPGQLLGGVSTTVNGIIQQLSGNLQPVYGSYRRSTSYG